MSEKSFNLSASNPSFSLFERQESQVVSKFLKHFHIRGKKPDLIFLSELAAAMGKFPFENITKILKKSRCGGNGTTAAFRLPDELFEDHLRYGTGGTCFSLNFFFCEILTECGFVCYPAMADRSYGKNTHCALIVLLDSKKYLIDPGFLINRPVPLPFTRAHFKTPPPEAERRVAEGGAPPPRAEVLSTVGEDEDRTRQTVIEWGFEMEFNSICLTWTDTPNVLDIYTIHLGSKKLRYRLKTNPVSWDDFQKYWADSFNWSGMNNVVVTMTINGQQIYLRNRHLRIVKKDEIIRKTISPNEIQFVKTLLGIDPKLIENAFTLS